MFIVLWQLMVLSAVAAILWITVTFIVALWCFVNWLGHSVINAFTSNS